ncbi:MAG: metal-sensitive transcriptional regulator [Microbacteriaceae bacterium]
MSGFPMSVSDRLTRLRRIEDQVRGLQHMSERGDACIDLLTQIKSVTRALEVRRPRCSTSKCVTALRERPRPARLESTSWSTT